MFKCRIEKVARSLAIEHKCLYGVSVFASAETPDGFVSGAGNGYWYVGSRIELEHIGCPSNAIVDPEQPCAQDRARAQKQETK